MPPKKRQKCTHPTVENYSRVAYLAKELARLNKQEYQYKALISQVVEMLAVAPFDFNEKSAANIAKRANEWLAELAEVYIQTSKTRDKALKTLRTVVPLDDDALKGAALLLTETETRLAAIDGLEERWKRIVRFDKASDLKKHTSGWLERFFNQWKRTSAAIIEMTQQMKKVLSKLSL